MKAFTSVLVMLSLTLCWSANHYIRQGASGNGNDWNNPYGQLPPTLVRGDTYYIADGNYPPYKFDDPGYQGKYIYIKKATLTDHGTSTGWQASYGDGTAHFTNTLTFSMANYEMDGQRGEGENAASYGFKISQNNACNSSGRYLVNIVCPNRNIKLKYIDMQHCGEYSTIPNGKKKIIYCVGSMSNLHLSYCYLHDVSVAMLAFHGGPTNSIVEHCIFARRRGDVDGSHGEAISWNGSGDNANNIIRYNVFKDIQGTGFVVIKDSKQGYFYIYGNIFYQTGSYSTGNGAIANTGGDTNHHMYVYNNTFANFRGNAGISWYNGSNNYAYNNLWYNCEKISLGGTATEANTVATTNPFVNSSGADFRLKSPTAAGKTLQSPYNLDLAGKVRGQDGVWDRGAFEYDPHQTTNIEYRLTNDEFRIPTYPTQKRLYNIMGQPILPNHTKATGIYLIPMDNTFQVITKIK